VRVDGATVRYGIHVLDLLPTQLAPADVSQAANDSTKRGCTAMMAVHGDVRFTPPESGHVRCA
jgi:hypothetical protein